MTGMVLIFLFLSIGKRTFMFPVIKVIKYDVDKCFYPVVGLNSENVFWRGFSLGGPPVSGPTPEWVANVSISTASTSLV